MAFMDVDRLSRVTCPQGGFVHGNDLGPYVYEQRISPLIAFIFYPPFKLKKISMCEARSGLSGRHKRI